MTDGDGKNSVKLLGVEDVQLSSRRKKRKKLGTDEFAHGIARIAVAQVCESLGFQAFQQSALDCLADVGVRYIREIGKTATSSANSGNRSQCNVFDVIQCLEDLGTSQGFLGASDVSHSLSGSGIVRDIIRYVTKAEEIPFAYLIPAFPVVKERKADPTHYVTDEVPPPDHIPSWLPRFPDPSTYANANSDNESNSETRHVRKIQHVDDPRVERPPNNLQQKIIRNVSESRVAIETFDAATVQQKADGNPFLLPPVRFGEKKVSLPELPFRFLEEEVRYRNGDTEENHGLTLEKHLQTNLAPTSCSCESEDRGNILSNERPCIKFNFRNNKRFPARVRSLQNEGAKDISVSFGSGHDGEELN